MPVVVRCKMCDKENIFYSEMHTDKGRYAKGFICSCGAVNEVGLEEIRELDLIDQLRMTAERAVEDRKIAELGPGGGNPNAKVGDHLEWKAAEEILRLREEIARLRTSAEGKLESEIIEETTCSKMPYDEFFATRDGRWWRTRAILAEQEVTKLRAKLHLTEKDLITINKSSNYLDSLIIAAHAVLRMREDYDSLKHDPRDDESPCPDYEIGTPDVLSKCESDGHYKCAKCKHLQLKDV